MVWRCGFFECWRNLYILEKSYQNLQHYIRNFKFEYQFIFTIIFEVLASSFFWTWQPWYLMRKLTHKNNNSISNKKFLTRMQRTSKSEKTKLQRHRFTRKTSYADMTYYFFKSLLINFWNLPFWRFLIGRYFLRSNNPKYFSKMLLFYDIIDIMIDIIIIMQNLGLRET